MKKKIVFLFPYPFTKINFLQYSLEALSQKIKIEIHDLSDLFISKKFKERWKSKLYKKNVIKFTNLFEWIFYITKKPSDTIIINETYNNTNSINCFFVKLILSIKKFVVFNYVIIDVIDVFFKKNLDYFLYKIFKQHKFDLIFYFNFIKKIIFSYLMKIIKYKKEIEINNLKKNHQYLNEKKLVCNIHSFDYSNFLISKKKKTKKYIVFLDTGFPYISGDRFLLNSIDYQRNEDEIVEYDRKVVSFFSILEDKFKKKVLVVPHPKFRGSKFYNENFHKNFKKYNKIDTNYAVRNAHFVVINCSTTSISFAVLNYKPIIFFFLKKKTLDTKINLIENKKIINLLNIQKISLDKIDIATKLNLNVNLKAYNNYRIRFLQNPDKKIRFNNNGEIIYNFIRENLYKKKINILH